MPQKTPDPAEIFEQIRANWAFEHLIVSVLAGAGVGGALTFLAALGGALITNGGIIAALGPALAKSVLIAVLIFLIGFLSGVLLIAPLFRALERAKRRSVWPYVAAALIIAGLALALVSNVRAAHPVGPGVAAPVLTASVVIAVLFARRMRPLWRAAEKAELAEDDTVKKLH